MSALHLPDRAARRGIARRFPSIGKRNYARGKLAGDPVYAATAHALAGAADPSLPLLDVGCGMGLLGHYLHACNALSGYLGIDHDERKIEAGRHAAAGLQGMLRLEHADAAELPDFRGHVALLDVLHYLPAQRQSPLLALLASRVAPGGLLVIRNVLRDANWRFHATVLEEKLLHASGWMRAGANHYPGVDDIREPLQDAGLVVRVLPLWGRTPFNSYMVIAQRKL